MRISGRAKNPHVLSYILNLAQKARQILYGPISNRHPILLRAFRLKESQKDLRLEQVFGGAAGCQKRFCQAAPLDKTGDLTIQAPVLSMPVGRTKQVTFFRQISN